MSKQNRTEIAPELLDIVTGGSLGYDPDGNGTYTMHCQYTKDTYYGVELNSVIEIAKYGATLNETAEDEVKIIDWAKQQGYIK